jgi:hypothetical protein
VSDAKIASLKDRTTEDEHTGAMRSVQAAEIVVSTDQLARLWEPANLERLARTYWRFLTRVTLGLVRVVYAADCRYVVLLARPFKLLTFKAPEYEMSAEHGLVRWRIERGLLVARHGHGGHGHLQIGVRRLGDGGSGQARVKVEVEVANFHPSIKTRLGKRFYYATQAKIHVLITHGFLRSLRKLDLAESRVGNLASEPGDADRANPQAVSVRR